MQYMQIMYVTKTRCEWHEAIVLPVVERLGGVGAFSAV